MVGNVKLMFQPGEEGYNGASHMIADGLLENPKVDAAIAMHCLTGSDWETGTILCASQGLAKASSDSFRIEVRGRAPMELPRSTALMWSTFSPVLQKVCMPSAAGN